MSTFILGPIQEAWVKSLEDHPERQMCGQLGRKFSDGTYKACCLGQAELILCQFQNRKPFWAGDHLQSQDQGAVLINFEDIGLQDTHGLITTDEGVLETYLSSMNDQGKTWPEIAAFIRANPERVFTHSV